MADQKPPARRRPKAKTPEEREMQLVASAYDLAEKQIKDGTASAQVVSYLLKQGSRTKKLEDARLESENVLLKAKVEAMERESKNGELLKKAMEVFAGYRGEDPVES